MNRVSLPSTNSNMQCNGLQLKLQYYLDVLKSQLLLGARPIQPQFAGELTNSPIAPAQQIVQSALNYADDFIINTDLTHLLHWTDRVVT